MQRTLEPLAEPNTPPPVQTAKSHHSILPFGSGDRTFHQLLKTVTVICRLISAERDVWTEQSLRVSDQEDFSATEGCFGRVIVPYRLYEWLRNTIHYLSKWTRKKRSPVVTLLDPGFWTHFAPRHRSMVWLAISIGEQTGQ